MLEDLCQYPLLRTPVWVRGFLFVTGGDVVFRKNLTLILFGLILAVNTSCGTTHQRVVSQSENQMPEVQETTGAASGDYILGAEDVVEILVWKNEALSRTVSIRPDGKISLPIVGDIQAAGLTPAQLRDSI